MWQTMLVQVVLVAGAAVSEPRVDTIEYAAPEKYLAIAETLGDGAEIARQAAELKGESDRETIRNVLAWMDETLKYDGEKAYAWRNFDTVVKEQCYGGCADQGIVCGVLLKGAGIPTVWVKTMDVDWIWDFKNDRRLEAWSGHVFLEVYVDGKWVLLDPGAKLLYEDYSPTARILPGNRFAYHKGDDPKAMVMSLEWEPWKEQTRAYFMALDEGLLPVDAAAVTSLEQACFVIADSPYWQMLSALAQRQGLVVRRSFNTGYDEYLPQAVGQTLLVETHDGVPIVELAVLEKYFPGASAGLDTERGAVKVAGTTIVFVEFDRLLEGNEGAEAPVKQTSSANAST